MKDHLNQEKTTVPSSPQTDHVWSQGKILPSLVIRFPQVRQTFEYAELQELADDIALNGLIQPSIVAKLSEEKFFEYVKVFEQISKSKLLISDVSYPKTIEDEGKNWYHVLIAGERRFRAHLILWEHGCSKCKADATSKNHTLTAGECFKKHFPEGLMEIRVGINIDPEHAKSIQFRENNYVRPPIHDEAYAYRDYFDHLRVINPGITMKAFAEKVGVSTEKVRKAIWFCELPERLREAVEEKLISYSNALELRRILQESVWEEAQRLKIVDAEIDFLLIHPKMKHEDYKKRIENLINSMLMPTLFDLNALQMTKKDKRKVVEQQLVQRLVLMEGYLKKVKALQRRGVIGKGNIYSGLSPTNWVKVIAGNLEQLVPGFTGKSQQRALDLFNLEKTGTD